ncbi:hypothetical protein K456DRAFT_1716161 [Colletotrichum gloeosporioides 23]|nr:hypothetical protein K456DRAFT_1716161 [Colletotrichum gloeosporioides 23]KAJ0290317.1 hypothetical protein CBS470a_003964 [Colletotrichum nupharicola]KAJ0317496.1 hypothetical protein Brms1b_004896 [Colletotrichum noveboracense]
MYIVIVSDAVKGTTVRVSDRRDSFGCVSVLKKLTRRRRTIVILEKKRLVLEILSIILFVLPFAGEVVGAAFGGAAMVARIAAVIGEIGNTALTIESIVSDPASAPFAVLSLLIGPYGGASERTSSQAIAEAAAARRALSADKIKLFGESFVAQDAKIQKIVNVCA